MNDLARQKLCEIVGKYGRALCDDPHRCEALLRDLCAAHRTEVNVLVCALKERVALELLAPSASTPREVLLARLTDRLADNLGLSHEAARWSVESWALALGAVAASELAQAHSSAGSIRGGSVVSGAPGPAPVSTGAPVGRTPVSPHSPSSPGNSANSASVPAPAPPRQSRSRTAWIAAGVLAALTFAGGTAATVLMHQREQIEIIQKQRQDQLNSLHREQLIAEAEKRRLENEKQELQRQNASLTEQVENDRNTLARLTGSSLSSVMPGVLPGAERREGALDVARQLIRVADNRSEVSGAMMSERRKMRQPLERTYGAKSPMVDRAYVGYPYDDRIRAYEVMEAEASGAAKEAGALSLDGTRRDPLVHLLDTQAEAFRQIRQALAYEHDHGYTAARRFWDAERKGPFPEAQLLWKQLRSVYVPWPGKRPHGESL